MTIYPTHTCFDDALDFLEDLARNYPNALYFEGYKLVHAICLMPGTDEPFAHAWVESGDGAAHFFGIVKGQRERICCDAKAYRADLRVQDFTEYSVREVCEMNKKYETYGPWEEKYLTLCKNGGKNRGDAKGQSCR